MDEVKKINGPRRVIAHRQWVNHFFALAMLLVFSLQARAGEVPNFDTTVSLTAREQAISVFLEELFGQIGVPVVVDTQVEGTVNGSFLNKSAKAVFDDISRSFGIVAYYDGAVAHIYTANDVSRRILAVPNHLTNKIVHSARDLSLTDSKNNLRSAGDGSLVVTGTKRFIEQVEELVVAAQSNSESYKPPLSFKVFYLKYAWAQDVTLTFGGRQVLIPGVANILNLLVGDSTTGQSEIDTYEQLLPASQEGLRGKGLAAIGRDGRLGLADADRPLPQVPIVYADNPDSNVRIGVDPRLNAIIVRDSPDRMSHYKALIDALDVESQMLEIEATIIDINTDRLRELGINWRGIRGNDEVLFGDGSAGDISLRPNQVITPSGRGGFVSFVTGNSTQIIGRINALEEEGAAKIVSSPQILTLSNVEAIFDTSSTFFVRVAGREEVDLFNVSVGTSLRVTPHVFKDEGEARIKLLVTIDDGKQEDQRVDDIPVITRSVISTQALLSANESVLVGGLVREATIDREHRVPLLGHIPIIGNLFKSKAKRVERIERMFLISPRLASNSGGKPGIQPLQKKQTTNPVTPDKQPQNSPTQISDRDISALMPRWEEDDYQMLVRVEPEYPEQAARNGIEGHCTVEYMVTDVGQVEDIRIVDCPNRVFAQASKDAVAQFKYRPRVQAGKPVEVAGVRTRFDFQATE